MEGIWWEGFCAHGMRECSSTLRYVYGSNSGTITKLLQFSYLDREYEALLRLPIATCTQVNVALK